MPGGFADDGKIIQGRLDFRFILAEFFESHALEVVKDGFHGLQDILKAKFPVSARHF